jgi:copper homeostasis protein (lipoprotein)
MNRTLSALACLAIALLAACNREQPAEPTGPIAAVPAAATGAIDETDATAVEPTALPSIEAPAFDQRAFAGTFSAGANRLELKPDGTYAMTWGDAAMDGTWTVEESDTRIRLDPNSKTEPDRVFLITSRDRLTTFGADGQPATGANAVSLERDSN